jgi:hypothetical protein
MAEFTHNAASHPRTLPLDGLITAILGDTGEQGRGQARRFAMAGTRSSRTPILGLVCLGT